mmetsp:Transcript_11813/g.50644  ORF Transcript_11813/g.50644 Transcript_11813/m.50644 type:complete len:228 (-) Transcript_11813:1175-1858(-)
MISSAISIFCCWITFRTTDSMLSAYRRLPPVPHVRSSNEKEGVCSVGATTQSSDAAALPPTPPSSRPAPTTSTTASRWMQRTSRFCPMRWLRATACSSFFGFGSGSYTTTVSALCRFKPRPAARMESRNRNLFESRALNWVMAVSRSSRDVLPSMRHHSNPTPASVESRRHFKYTSSKSNSFVMVENKSTLWPALRSFTKSRSRTHSLPHARTSASPPRQSPPFSAG